jgi:glutamyl-tRNA reductase
MKGLYILAFTHHQLDLPVIGSLHCDDTQRKDKLQALRVATGAEELVYLATCNRVELVFASEQDLNRDIVIGKVLDNIGHEPDYYDVLAQNASWFEDRNAGRHLLEVASSLDSLIVGEREIITQVKDAFDRSVKDGVCGDMLKVLMRKTIETAKRVFSETSVSARPVSVVSLAFRMLKNWDLPQQPRILVVGAGQTNTSMVRFLKKYGYNDFVIFNRTFEKAQLLAQEVGGKALPFDGLKTYSEGFDLLLTCTGAVEPVIDNALLIALLANESGNKYVVDLAIPADLSVEAVKNQQIQYLGVEQLKPIADENLRLRTSEVVACQAIIDEAMHDCYVELESRKVELAMREVPEKVKEIKRKALEEVYSKEISSLDPQSREVLDKILEYMEKKYISVPMKMAREIIVEQKVSAK